MGEIGAEAKPAVPALIQLLGNDNREVRSQAARPLGEIGPEAKPAKIGIRPMKRKTSAKGR